MFKVFRVYSDLGSICEDGGSDFGKILLALNIYLQDPDCIGVKVWRKDNGAIILDYWKEEYDHDERAL